LQQQKKLFVVPNFDAVTKTFFSVLKRKKKHTRLRMSNSSFFKATFQDKGTAVKIVLKIDYFLR